MAYGFRDIEYFKLKILQSCGWRALQLTMEKNPIFLLFTGYPVSGTSIVGVNLVTFTAICLALDVPYRIKLLKKTVSSRKRYLIVADSLMLVLYGLAFIGLYALYATYGYKSTHLVGGIIGLVMFLALMTRNNHINKTKGIKKD